MKEQNLELHSSSRSITMVMAFIGTVLCCWWYFWDLLLKFDALFVALAHITKLNKFQQPWILDLASKTQKGSHTMYRLKQLQQIAALKGLVSNEWMFREVWFSLELRVWWVGVWVGVSLVCQWSLSCSLFCLSAHICRIISGPGLLVTPFGLEPCVQTLTLITLSLLPCCSGNVSVTVG